MARIFINFRNGDGEYAADVLHRELSRRFGEDDVFRSSNSIAPGDNYVTALLDEVQRCDVMLAVIGPRWASVVDAEGNRRIENEGDWVRREIATALKAGRRVIPVFPDGVRPLDGSRLPKDIALLADCQYRRMSHRDTRLAIDGLERDLRRMIPGLSRKARGRRHVPAVNIRNEAVDGGVINQPVGGDVNISGDQVGVKHQHHGPGSSTDMRTVLAEIVDVLNRHDRELRLKRHELRDLGAAVYVLRRASKTGDVSDPEISRAANVVWNLAGSLLTSLIASGVLEGFKAIVDG